HLEFRQQVVVHLPGPAAVDVQQRRVHELAAALGEGHDLRYRFIGERRGGRVVDDVLGVGGSDAHLVGPRHHGGYGRYVAVSEVSDRRRRGVEVGAGGRQIDVDRADAGGAVER